MGRVADIVISLAKKKETKHITPDYIVWDVDNFNIWFNHPANQATYAHSGIFGRTDKLSGSHIDEYLKICYGIIKADEITKVHFRQAIAENWRNRASHRSQ